MGIIGLKKVGFNLIDRVCMGDFLKIFLFKLKTSTVCKFNAIHFFENFLKKNEFFFKILLKNKLLHF